MTAPLACPFCGATEHDHDPESGLHGVQENLAVSQYDGRVVFFASCNVCGGSGPLCDDAETAAARFSMSPHRSP